MNSKENRKLTPKQENLVNKLEKIRQDKKNIQQNLSKDAAKTRAKKIRRNEDVEQERSKKKDKKKTYTQPAQEKLQKRKEFHQSTTSLNKRKAKVETTHKRKKKPNKLTEQLSNGHSLSQAIILSEILDKPVSLRK